MSEWELYGSSTPFDVGGGWYRELSQGVYQLIDIEPCINRVDYCYFIATTVDLSLDFVDVPKIGMEYDCISPADYAIAALKHYGTERFGGSSEYINKADGVELLPAYGIQI
jgi:hypothetical protein